MASPQLGPELSAIQSSMPPQEQMGFYESDEGEVFEGYENVSNAPPDEFVGPTTFAQQGKSRVDKKRPVSEYTKELYRKPVGELSSLQKRLFAGGFYDRSLDWDDVRSGDYDIETEQAWGRAVQRAAAFYGADQKLTVDQVIDQAAQARMEAGKGGFAGGGSGSGRGSGSGNPLTMQVSHPDDIRTGAMKVSSQILGRGWSEEELNRFVLTYQQMERAAQSAAHKAGESGGTTTQAPNLGVAAERAARASNPAAAEATDMVGAYDMILKAMNALGGK